MGSNRTCDPLLKIKSIFPLDRTLLALRRKSYGSSVLDVTRRLLDLLVREKFEAIPGSRTAAIVYFVLGGLCYIIGTWVIEVPDNDYTFVAMMFGAAFLGCAVMFGSMWFYRRQLALEPSDWFGVAVALLILAAPLLGYARVVNVLGRTGQVSYSGMVIAAYRCDDQPGHAVDTWSDAISQLVYETSTPYCVEFMDDAQKRFVVLEVSKHAYLQTVPGQRFARTFTVGLLGVPYRWWME